MVEHWKRLFRLKTDDIDEKLPRFTIDPPLDHSILSED